MILMFYENPSYSWGDRHTLLCSEFFSVEIRSYELFAEIFLILSLPSN
jgi:hypothetical protein